MSPAKGYTFGAEDKIPWDDYGYIKLSQFHIRYYYIFEEAIDKVLRGEMSWEEAIKDNTGIAEVWFKSDSSLFRFDRYIEKLEAKCQSFIGLEGYLEGCTKSWIYPETKFKEPKVVYKVLLVETTVSPDVFANF